MAGERRKVEPRVSHSPLIPFGARKKEGRRKTNPTKSFLSWMAPKSKTRPSSFDRCFVSNWIFDSVAVRVTPLYFSSLFLKETFKENKERGESCFPSRSSAVSRLVLPGAREGLTERQMKEGFLSRAVLRHHHTHTAARGFCGASLPVGSACVSARSNSQIPYLEARGSSSPSREKLCLNDFQLQLSK